MESTSENKVRLPLPAEKLIPHRPPMLLIKELIKREGDMAAASARIGQNSICSSSEAGILPEYFIEIIAQTMAAANGYDALCAHDEPKSGFIVGIDNYCQHHTVKTAQDFDIFVVKNMEFGTMKVMEGEVFAEGVRIASVELKVWEGNADEI